MAVSDVALPKTSQTGTNEWADVEDNDDRLLEVINCDRDSRLAEAAGASIDGGSVRRGKTIIATEETRNNTAYGTLTTPDQVSNIVMPTDGLIVVAYQALWKSSVSGAGSAAIFVGANQLVTADGNGAPGAEAAEAATGGTTSYATLATAFYGLAGGVAPSSAETLVTTGQTVKNALSGAGGVVHIFAAAGTYDISVQFKASSGSVTAKERKLWVWTESF